MFRTVAQAVEAVAEGEQRRERHRTDRRREQHPPLTHAPPPPAPAGDDDKQPQQCRTDETPSEAPYPAIDLVATDERCRTQVEASVRALFGPAIDRAPPHDRDRHEGQCDRQ